MSHHTHPHHYADQSAQTDAAVRVALRQLGVQWLFLDPATTRTPQGGQFSGGEAHQPDEALPDHPLLRSSYPHPYVFSRSSSARLQKEDLVNISTSLIGFSPI
jgi:hypothetical protein